MLEKIGKYEIAEQIGVGGFGAVFRGRDPFIKRTVAIKTCSVNDEEIKSRFFREAELAGNLHHRHITTIYDFGVENGIPYIVQEFLTGEDLDKQIKRGDSVPVVRKVEILMAIAEGLHYAHEAQIIHRDIKPANIRILEDGNVKIMDFGIAKSLEIGVQSDADGDHPRHLRVPRAGADPRRAGGPAHGRVRPRRRRVRAASRTASRSAESTCRPCSTGSSTSSPRRSRRSHPTSLRLWPRSYSGPSRSRRTSGTRRCRICFGTCTRLYRELTGASARFSTVARLTAPSETDLETTIATPSHGMATVHITPPSGALARAPDPARPTPSASAPRPPAGLELVNFQDPDRSDGRQPDDGAASRTDRAGPRWRSSPRSRWRSPGSEVGC